MLLFTRKPGIDFGHKLLVLLKAGFAFRRKFLLKNLRSVVDKAKVQRLPEIWADLQLSEKARAEELTPQQWREVFQRIYERN